MENEDPVEYWITNITYLNGKKYRANILVQDLQLLIRPGQSYDLLNKKHFSYTLDQINKSAESGSLYKKRDKIKIRKVAPKVIVVPGVYLVDMPNFVKPLRSQVEIIEPKYEELEISAEEMIDEITNEEE